MKDLQEKLFFATVPSIITIVAQKLIPQRQPALLGVSQSLLAPDLFKIVWPIILLISGVILANTEKGLSFNFLLANTILNMAFVIFTALGNKPVSQLLLAGMIITIIGYFMTNKKTNINWWFVPYVIFLLILVLIMTILTRLQAIVNDKFGKDSDLAKILDYLGKLKN